MTAAGIIAGILFVIFAGLLARAMERYDASRYSKDNEE